ncbi:DNA methyltransferase, partial [bacterium]|nr:DNA methyltransferase [bacterium]
PRVPFAKDLDLFMKMGELGKELVDLHLLKSKKLENKISEFPIDGSSRLGKTKNECRNYNPDEKRVYINKEMQYFDGIEPEVWDYRIGGYQVLDKWLDSHKERVLSLDDIRHFCKVITALSETIKVQREIDELYPEVERDLMEWGI